MYVHVNVHEVYTAPHCVSRLRTLRTITNFIWALCYESICCWILFKDSFHFVLLCLWAFIYTKGRIKTISVSNNTREHMRVSPSPLPLLINALRQMFHNTCSNLKSSKKQAKQKTNNNNNKKTETFICIISAKRNILHTHIITTKT